MNYRCQSHNLGNSGKAWGNERVAISPLLVADSTSLYCAASDVDEICGYGYPSVLWRA